jgi:hypothetical protein
MGGNLFVLQGLQPANYYKVPVAQSVRAFDS